jgi:transposase
MFSLDMRWRCIVLVQVYGIEVEIVGTLLGMSRRSVTRFVLMFAKTGTVKAMRSTRKKNRWPDEVNAWIDKYASTHPCFYIEELQEALKAQFPWLLNISTATICRALMHDLKLTRKGIINIYYNSTVFIVFNNNDLCFILYVV